MLVIGTFVSTMWVKADEPLPKYRVERMEFAPNAPGAAGILILSELINGEYVLRENPNMPEPFSKGLLAYCFDLEVGYPDDGVTYYDYQNLNQLDMFVGVEGELRAILFNGYPNRSLQELEAMTNISGLTHADAIKGTQYAIWYYTNDYIFVQDETNVKAHQLYEFLIDISPMAPVNGLVLSDLDLNDYSATNLNDTTIFEVVYHVDSRGLEKDITNLVVELSDEVYQEYPDARFTFEFVDNTLSLFVEIDEPLT